jgi:hypothetical protein
MARSCETCQHPNRVDIDRRCAAGESSRHVAAAYGLSHVSLCRHRRNHAKIPTANQVKQEAVNGTIALATMPGVEEFGARYASMADRLDRLIAQAEADGKTTVAIAGLRELRATLDSHSRLAGHDRSGNTTVTVNVAVTQADPRVQTLVDMLRPAINAEGFTLLENVIDVPPS